LYLSICLFHYLLTATSANNFQSDSYDSDVAWSSHSSDAGGDDDGSSSNKKKKNKKKKVEDSSDSLRNKCNQNINSALDKGKYLVVMDDDASHQSTLLIMIIIISS